MRVRYQLGHKQSVDAVAVQRRQLFTGLGIAPSRIRLVFGRACINVHATRPKSRSGSAAMHHKMVRVMNQVVT